VARRLAEALPSPFLRLAGDPDRQVTRVAACGGAGESLLPAALAAGAEVYVTGDLRHHVALDAMTQGLALVDAGHYATEAAVLPAVQRRLGEAARARGLQARLLASAVRTEPWAAWEEGTP
jgi:putative NIF3 family GTP cyclohydrolase 1 type 2